MPSILLTNYYSQELLSIVKQVVPEGFDIISLDEATQKNVISKIQNAEYLLVGGRIKIDEKVLDAATKLKMIQRTGVGLDSLSFEAVKKKNIPVYVNPGVNARSVAEHSIMLLLSVLRNVSNVDSIIKSGTWKKHELGIQNNELFGKTVGLIGLGNIGTHVAKMLKPFGVKIIYNKRTRLSKETESNLGITYSSFDDLLKQADIISLHCPLNDETERLIDRDQFSLMKKGAIIINTSRGKLINEEALIQNLKSQKLKGAGLDVYEQEPLSSNSELLKLSNVILTPHISGITKESFETMMVEAFANIQEFEKGNTDVIESKKLKI